jgi:hypothetical protein
MLRVRFALTAVAALALMSGSAGAQAPTQDFVAGTGTFGALSFSISATSGPSGENPSGQVDVGFLQAPDLHSSGAVTCLEVRGNAATLQYFDATLLGAQVLVEVTDNSASGQPDTIDVQTQPTRSPTDCSPAVPSAFLVPIDSGDLTVFDAQARPTSKNQCKDGGYRQFGFKNQGQCIAFVNRGPQP